MNGNETRPTLVQLHLPGCGGGNLSIGMDSETRVTITPQSNTIGGEKRNTPIIKAIPYQVSFFDSEYSCEVSVNYDVDLSIRVSQRWSPSESTSTPFIDLCSKEIGSFLIRLVRRISATWRASFPHTDKFTGAHVGAEGNTGADMGQRDKTIKLSGTGEGVSRAQPSGSVGDNSSGRRGEKIRAKVLPKGQAKSSTKRVSKRGPVLGKQQRRIPGKDV